jgi:Na+/H+ antiporter NhaD/arsenite permease-like protein
MVPGRPQFALEDDRTASHRWGWAILVVPAILAVAALIEDPADVPAVARATAVPFATVGAVVVAGWAAVRSGVIDRALARIPMANPTRAAFGVFTITALLAGLVNLDVAAVVMVPVALEAAVVTDASAELMVIGVAIVANACSFLLPTANITSLLVMANAGAGSGSFVATAWPSWLAVTVLTVTLMTLLVRAVPSRGGAPFVRRTSWSLPRIGVDLLGMFVVATSLRVLLPGGWTLPAGPAQAAAVGSLLASGLNNLPVAAILHPAAGASMWPAILAMTMGSNLLVTGSVATVIVRRLARESGGSFSAARFSAVGLVVVPLQLAVAAAVAWLLSHV